MKRFVYLSAAMFLFMTRHTLAQDIRGSWNGALDLGPAKLHVVLHISKSGQDYVVTMDSPDQHATGIPTSNVRFTDGNLHLEVPSLTVVYEGTLTSDTLMTGTFSQAGNQLPLNLIKGEIAPLNRPQEPKAPFPYKSEEITFANTGAGISLAGTLTLPPKGDHFSAVVLISGSGPQNRDEEILGHKPFLLLADALTRQGIAVLRYDDRGNGASTGNFASATTRDFATDATAAFDYLKTRKEINPAKIGLLGHSEGGVIAPMLAAEHPDITFIVLLAGPGLPADELMLIQTRLVNNAMGSSYIQTEAAVNQNRQLYAISKHGKDAADIHTKLAPLVQANPGLAQQEQVLASPWMRYFLNIDPGSYLRKVKCPVLALNGSKDVQVAPKENLAAIQRAVSVNGNKQVVTKELEGLNHLFQECVTGSPAEYEKIAQTMSPLALDEIVSWITSRSK